MTTRDLMMPDESDAESTRRRELPARIEPMMLAHFALTGDVDQYREWRQRVDDLHHQRAIEEAPDTESRVILEEREAWEQIRTSGKLGASFGMGLAALEISVLVQLFAFYGMGWLMLLVALLPIPIAWRVGTKLWEEAALAGMRDIGNKPTLKRRLKALFRGLMRGFGAGFGFGFTLVFLQGLLTWFINPAPSLGLELLSDIFHGAGGGLVGGMFGMLLAPLLARGTPSVERAELERAQMGALAGPEEDPFSPEST